MSMTLIAVRAVWTKAKTKKKKKVDSLFQDAGGKGKERKRGTWSLTLSQKKRKATYSITL